MDTTTKTKPLWIPFPLLFLLLHWHLWLKKLYRYNRIIVAVLHSVNCDINGILTNRPVCEKWEINKSSTSNLEKNFYTNNLSHVVSIFSYHTLQQMPGLQDSLTAKKDNLSGVPTNLIIRPKFTPPKRGAQRSKHACAIFWGDSRSTACTSTNFTFNHAQPLHLCYFCAARTFSSEKNKNNKKEKREIGSQNFCS